MIQTSPIVSPAKRKANPSQALVEVLLHEIANPLQAAHSALRLWQGENANASAGRERLARLEHSFERVAQVLRIIQTVKDDALAEPQAVPAERFIEELGRECRMRGVEFAVVNSPPSARFSMHSSALSTLLAAWAFSASTSPAMAKLKFETTEGERVVVTIATRIGAANAVRNDLNATSAAGYAAAIGEFMRSAEGNATIAEDDQGAFEIALHIMTWPRADAV